MKTQNQWSTPWYTGGVAWQELLQDLGQVPLADQQICAQGTE